jgi:hypothetical protein
MTTYLGPPKRKGGLLAALAEYNGRRHGLRKVGLSKRGMASTGNMVRRSYVLKKEWADPYCDHCRLVLQPPRLRERGWVDSSHFRSSKHIAGLYGVPSLLMLFALSQMDGSDVPAYALERLEKAIPFIGLEVLESVDSYQLVEDFTELDLK